MNAKAARLARQVNRLAGTLVKRSKLVADERGVIRDRDPRTMFRVDKLPRKVKAWFAGLNHKTRGRATGYWADRLEAAKLLPRTAP